jgi:hypothetical protein
VGRGSAWIVLFIASGISLLLRGRRRSLSPGDCDDLHVRVERLQRLGL